MGKLTVRLWNLESDEEAKVFKLLEDKLWKHIALCRLAILTAGRSTLRKCQTQGELLTDTFTRMLQYYLEQDDYVVLVGDVGEPSELIDQVRRIVKDFHVPDRVFFASDVQGDEFKTAPEWQDIVSRLHTDVETEWKQLREQFDKTMAGFHAAFAGVPEEEVIRDIEQAIAEVRRERE